MRFLETIAFTPVSQHEKEKLCIMISDFHGIAKCINPHHLMLTAMSEGKFGKASILGHAIGITQ